MIRLLKAELYKIFKEKALLICAIITIGFALLTVGASALVKFSFPDDGISMSFGARSILYSSTSLANNGGIIIIIAAAIILCKDFSYGTIRNQITCGHSRLNIFASKFFTGAIVILGLGTINLLVTGCLGTAILGYGKPFSFKEASILIRDYALVMLIYIWVLSLLLISVFAFKKTIFALVLTLGINIALTLVSAIMDIGEFPEAVHFISSLVPVKQLSDLMNSQTTSSILKIIFSNLVYIPLNLGLGVYIFYKSDLK